MKRVSLLCYDLNTGEQLWNVAATNIPGSPSEVPENNCRYRISFFYSSNKRKNKFVLFFATGDVILYRYGREIYFGPKNIGVPEKPLWICIVIIDIKKISYLYNSIIQNIPSNYIIKTRRMEMKSGERKEMIKFHGVSPSLAYVKQYSSIDINE